MVCTATKKVFEDVKQIARAQVEFESAHAVVEEVKDMASQISSKLLREGKDVDFETLAKTTRDILGPQKSIVLRMHHIQLCAMMVVLVSCLL